MSKGSTSAVEVNYTLGDLYAVAFHSWLSLLIRILLLPGLVLVLLAILTVFGGTSLIDSVLGFPWEFILGLMGLIILIRMAVAPLANYFDGRRARNLGPIRFELRGEGIRVEARDGQTLVYWSAVKRVKATKSRLFLFTGQALAFVVPMRAFSNRGEFEAEVIRAREYWQTSRP